MLLKIFIFNFLFGWVQFKVCANECGAVAYIASRITGGSQISRGEWPFIAALYYVNDATFFCGGTLISAKHVLTAAHCVRQKNLGLTLAPEDVVVLLGAYNLDSKIERGVQQRDVEIMYIHPEWKVYHEKYDADIAILVLSNIVEFTKYIRAVCLPADDEGFSDVEGSIVGWGLAENTTINKHESIPRHAYTIALNDSYCYTTDRFLAIFSSTRTFCGGGEGGSPNKGDSGGGFFVLSGTIWIQYGIISASLSDARGIVLPDAFTVYTNVKRFKSWIIETVQSSGSEVTSEGATLNFIAKECPAAVKKDEQLKQKISFYCNYEFTSFYTCSVWESNATIENLEVESFTGTHLPRHADHNVTQIWFWDGTLSYIPDGIGRIFKHLERFLVGYETRNLGLIHVKRSNFENMELLTLLEFHSGNIEVLDQDTLWDLSNLEVFTIKNNRLKELHEKTFEKNTKLRFVSANSNQLEFLPRHLFKHNPLIKELYFKDNKLRTISIDFSELKMVQTIELNGNTCIDKALVDVDNLSDLQNMIQSSC